MFMNYELEKYLQDYSKDTLKAIELLEKEDLDSLGSVLDSRQDIINCIEILDYTKDDFINISKRFKIVELQKRLSEVMIEKKLEYKKEIGKIKDKKDVNKSYTKEFSVDSIYFNKKI